MAMAKPASLKPHKNRAREALGLTPWVLNVPPELSETGKRSRSYWATERQARAEAERLKTRRHNFGASLGALSSSQIVEAADCQELLSDFPEVSLKDAVLHYRQTLQGRAKSVPFLDLFNRYLDFKQKRSEKYLRELRITRDRFPSLHPTLVCDITHETLEPLLLPLPSGSRNATMRYWRAVFRYGIKRGYTAINPIDRLDFMETNRREVEILEVDEVGRLLAVALETDLELLPFLVLGFFCGIRPDGELPKLEWRDIDFDDRTVTIRPEVSKTRRRRFVDLSRNAIAWLTEYRLRGGRRVGQVVLWAPENLRNHRLANRAAAKVTRWPQDAMRHSYCSYWLALHKDVNKLVLQSGHKDAETMWRHYHKGTRREEAVKYWAIRPAKRRDQKIVPFAA
jgi:integrase